MSSASPPTKVAAFEAFGRVQAKPPKPELFESANQVLNRALEEKRSNVSNMEIYQATHYCAVRKEALQHLDQIPTPLAIVPDPKQPSASVYTLFFKGNQWPAAAPWCQQYRP